jgi:hypothetical protein
MGKDYLFTSGGAFDISDKSSWNTLIPTSIPRVAKNDGVVIDITEDFNFIITWNGSYLRI